MESSTMHTEHTATLSPQKSSTCLNYWTLAVQHPDGSHVRLRGLPTETVQCIKEEVRKHKHIAVSCQLFLPGHEQALCNESTLEASGIRNGSLLLCSSLPVQAPQELKFADALHFVDRVREVFSEQPNLYADFMSLLRSFQEQRCSINQVVHAVNELFGGHPTLITGFGIFLPPGWQYCEPETPFEYVRSPDTSRMRADSDETAAIAGAASRRLSFLPPHKTLNSMPSDLEKIMGVGQNQKAVSTALQYLELLHSKEDPRVYRAFVDLMQKFKRGWYDIPGVTRRVHILFQGQNELIGGFSAFLTNATAAQMCSGTTVAQHAPAAHAAAVHHQRKPMTLKSIR